MGRGGPGPWALPAGRRGRGRTAGVGWTVACPRGWLPASEGEEVNWDSHPPNGSGTHDRAAGCVRGRCPEVPTVPRTKPDDKALHSLTHSTSVRGFRKLRGASAGLQSSTEASILSPFTKERGAGRRLPAVTRGQSWQWLAGRCLLPEPCEDRPRGHHHGDHPGLKRRGDTSAHLVGLLAKVAGGVAPFPGHR